MINFAAIVPHPPLIVPGVGKDEEYKVRETKEAMEKLAEKLAESEPDTIIFITPHGLLYPDLFNVNGMVKLKGDFEAFGKKDISWQGQNDLDLASMIADKAENEGVPTVLYDSGESEYVLDHGVMVPLYFFKEKIDNNFQVLPIAYTYGSRAEHFLFGQIIASVCEQTDKNIAIIASGDLSHRLNATAPEGFSYDGEKFDKEIVELIKKDDTFSLMNMDEDLIDSAGECGYKSILVLLGALSNMQYKPEVYSYEGPLGVGYTVANMGIKS